MTALETPLPLFVYGTLKTGQGNHASHFTTGAIRAVRPAKVRDISLYADDRIPYAVPRRGSTTYGEVINLADAERPGAADQARRAIDRLEGFDPAHPDRGWYRRIAIVAVTLTNATPVTCWIYVMAEPPPDARPVLGGVWLSGSRSGAPLAR